MNLEGLKINFLGDSITEGVGASGADKVYHALIKKDVGLTEARNYGISGTRFAIQKNITDAWVDKNSFCERYTTMDDDADIVMVFGGTNDYGHGDAPLGTFDDRTPDSFYGACHTLFSGLIRKYLGKTIVIMTPLHRINEMRNTGDAKPCGVGTLKEYVEIIREVAQYYSLPVLDLFKSSGLQPEIEEIKKLYMPDGLHPSDAGNRIIADKVISFLRAL